MTWIALYDTGFMDGYRSIVLGAVAIAAPLGDLFESALKRDAEVKDAGRLLGAHGGMLDRLDAHLFAAVAAYYVIAAFGFMKRPPERERLLRLIRVTLAGGVLIVLFGVLAVVGGVFDPSREERARDWVEREYGAELGACEERPNERLECELDRPSRARLGRPVGDGVCVFVFENANVALDGYAPCRGS